MGKKHVIYVIGGPSRAGKSSIGVKIRGKSLPASLPPEAFCRSIIKNLLTETIPQDTTKMFFEGMTTFGPTDAQQTKPFKADIPLTESIAPLPGKDLLIEIPSDYIRSIIRLIFVGENRGLSAIGFDGQASFTDASGKEIAKQPIKIEIQGEDPVAWKALAGMLTI